MHLLVAPLYPAGREPLPPGLKEEDREQFMQAKKYQQVDAKTVMAGVGGLGIGAFFSLMSASFAYEDPYLRQQTQTGMTNTQKAREIFKEMGRGMWRTGAKNDMVNPVAAGFVAGGVLARHSGPRAVFGGGLAFAAFSGAIDWFLRRESSE
ncbi:mitochondrial import inner membrane translocase subunit TIM22 [Pisolithus croceorrhizus]|nr:mitochondrial import inner membrane translocase subunit TIM22 [Pisolithus croceorrhizus]